MVVLRRHHYPSLRQLGAREREHIFQDRTQIHRLPLWRVGFREIHQPLCQPLELCELSPHNPLELLEKRGVAMFQWKDFFHLFQYNQYRLYLNQRLMLSPLE